MGDVIRGEAARLRRENDRLKAALCEKTKETETALCELAELFAQQDDAIVELAQLMEEEAQNHGTDLL